MRYCARCVMPSTKPGLRLDDEGVCNACRSNEKKKRIDWKARGEELRKLCDEIRGTNGNGYDCVVPVSGGKDSIYQAWMMKVVHRMNALCVAVVPHLQTEEGISNLNTMVKSLGVDLIRIHLKHGAFKHIRTLNFHEMGEPNWADHLSVFSGVARVAYMYRVPLVVWGEDIAVEYGGTTTEKRVSSAEGLIDNDLIKGRQLSDFYRGAISDKDTYFYRHPDKEELRKRNFRSIYLGYYHNWDGYTHYLKAKELGFTGRRAGPLSGNILNYDNIDEKLCEINIWFKFLKFGFWRPTDQSCYHIWNGRMSREEAVELVNKKQYEFPGEYLPEFLEFHQMKESEFYETVEKFRNKDIWHKIGGQWRLKVPLG